MSIGNPYKQNFFSTRKVSQEREGTSPSVLYVDKLWFLRKVREGAVSIVDSDKNRMEAVGIETGRPIPRKNTF